MKIFLLLLFNFCYLASYSQSKNSFYALDAKMNQTVLDSSKYILWIHEKEDSNWHWDYYYTWGPLVKSQSFADHDGTILNGKSFIYNRMGNLDSLGNFDHGKKNGSFYKYKSYSKDSLKMTMQYDYEEDSLVKTINMLAKLDSAKKDTSNEKESEYPGGVQAWYSYMSHNLQYPDRAVSKEIQGNVQIEFVVGKDGSVEDIFVLKSVEYSLDQAALKLIYDSGKWVPSTKNGIALKSYKIQPVNFKLDVN
jgi:protein TonB